MISNFVLKVVCILDNNKIINLIDETKIKYQYKIKMNKELDLSNPKTYNEKIQWLKLNDRKDIYSKMVDKYEVKEYVKNIIGEEFIIPTLGIFNKFDEINFDKLPNQFVIKCTHDSGGFIICKDKKSFDIKKARKFINKHLKRDYYRIYREFPYKNVIPRIIVEKYMEDKSIHGIRDYKFFCFDGEPKLLYISDGSHSKKPSIAFFDMKYKQLDIKRDDYIDYIDIPSKPKKFNEMIKLAKKLSKGMKHIRVDFYEVNNHIYFGELTFYTGAGYMHFNKDEWDYKLGDMINIP